MAVSCGMPRLQYSARSARFFKLLTHLYISIFCHYGHVTWLNSRSVITACVSVMCRMPSTRVRRRRKFGRRFLVRNNFELISTVKMESRHPVEGSFDNEFSSIYNHCGVMAAGSRKMLKKLFFFCVFLEKNDLLLENSQNSVPKRFIATRIDVLCSNVVKFGWRRSVKSCIYMVRDRKWFQYSAEV